MKDILNINFTSNYQPISTCFSNIIRKIKKKKAFLACIRKHVSAVIMGSYKTIIFFQIANPTNTPRVLNDRPFPRLFNMQYTCCV